MEVLVVSDPTQVATQKGLGFVYRHCSNTNFSIFDQSFTDQSSTFHISSILVSPPVKTRRHRISRQTVLRKKQRIVGCGDEDDGEGEEYIFSFDGGDGFFSGSGGSRGGGGSGGKGWNFDSDFGEQNWDESSSWFSPSSTNFAFGFMYEVVYWIALSNCVHFAFKKIVRFLIDGFSGVEREKVPLRLGGV